MRQLYFGDCLDVLKALNRQHPDGLIDLVYIDPPFNSSRNYNVLFESADLPDATAQKEAFADTWSNVSYIDQLNDIHELHLDLYQILQTLEKANFPKPVIAYLCTMALRLIYIHKILKPDGVFFLHCDPEMSHYLKMICDMIYGKQMFINEIIWKRTSAHANAKRFGAAHDTILFYAKGESFTWHEVYQEYDPDYVDTYYRYKDPDGRRFMSSDLGGHKGVNKEVEWRGLVRPWRYPVHRLDELDAQGKIFWTKNGIPRYKRFLDEMKGIPCQDLWDDIEPLRSWHKEKLGYPTQKPEGLLERIIATCTTEGDIVADFFCGCGTTIAVAERLGRQWIGADVSHLAIRLILDRLTKPYQDNPELYKQMKQSIDVLGFPKDVASAKELAVNSSKGRLGFQDWVIEVVLGGVSNPKKSADGGWDGYLSFFTSDREKATVLIEVKSGNVSVKNIREFIQVVDSNRAAAGIFVCFAEQVTKPMLAEAKSQGYYDAETWGNKYAKIQLLTVEDLLAGQSPSFPFSTRNTFKAEGKSVSKKGKPLGLF